MVANMQKGLLQVQLSVPVAARSLRRAQSGCEALDLGNFFFVF
jgi:hypothetical protein